jgi:hypothetical protein
MTTEYKILETVSYPTDKEIDDYEKDVFIHESPGYPRSVHNRGTYPSTSELTRRAKNELTQLVQVYLNNGWKLSGGVAVTFIQKHTYHNGYFDKISYSQAITKENN